MLSTANLSKSQSSEKVFSEDDSSMEPPVWEDDGLPPSYNSLFSQLKDANDSPENAIGFFKKAIQTFAGTSKCLCSSTPSLQTSLHVFVRNPHKKFYSHISKS